MAKRVMKALGQLELAETRKLSERELRSFSLLCAHGCSQAEMELARRRPSFGEQHKGRHRDIVSFSGERAQDAVSFVVDLESRRAKP